MWLLNRSKAHKDVKNRVTALESQVGTLTQAVHDIMRAYSDLARVTVDNRKSLEEVFAYLTDPLGDLPEPTEPTNDMTPEERAAYKRNLN